MTYTLKQLSEVLEKVSLAINLVEAAKEVYRYSSELTTAIERLVAVRKDVLNRLYVAGNLDFRRPEET
jgi:hypothetical protein